MTSATARLTLLDRLIGWVSPDAGLRRKRARTLLARAYEGAARTDGWRPRRAGASANADHAADARELRIRARAMVQNVPYIARGVQALVSAAIGTGIEPRFDGADSARLNDLWSKWERVADADAIFDLYGLQAAAYRAMVQDGEVLIRRRTRRPEDGLPVPMQLQLLEIDWLDSGKNGSNGGNTIINGIEYDALGKPAAYWLYENHPGDAFMRGRATAGVSRRIPASDIIHLFAPSRPGQGRGITRLASVIARTRDLSLYEDAELQRKNLETRLGVLVSGDASTLDTGIPTYGSVTAGAGPQANDLGVLPSGGITELPPGMNVTALEPKAAPGYVDYCKFQLHLIAAGLGVPYEALTGDMAEVNFSSARIRQIDFRRDIEQEQWLVIVPRLCQPIADWFIEAAQLIGAAGRGQRSVDWSTPRWDYVNPAQDVAAEIDAISAGLLSPSEALRRRGYKPEQVFAEIGKDFRALHDSGALDLMQFLMAKGGGVVYAAASQSDATQSTQGS
jgi:lambda family phage portal protein